MDAYADRPAIFNGLCAVIDVDEERLESFLPYLESLLDIGVNLNDLELQDAIEAYPNQIGTACQSVIEYAGWLVSWGKGFDSSNHATRCLTRAFSEGWQPYQGWNQYAPLAAQSRYVSAYELAYRLIREINQIRGYRAWDVRILDPLSDQAITALIPELELERSRS
jgi:hypothetical protein